MENNKRQHFHRVIRRNDASIKFHENRSYGSFGQKDTTLELDDAGSVRVSTLWKDGQFGKLVCLLDNLLAMHYYIDGLVSRFFAASSWNKYTVNRLR
jgi:hypothetical protein